jgi:signal transduction histidine kinase
MTFIPETHSLLVSAAFLAAFALIALVTLWQVRDLGVYLWTASGLAGALYSTVSAGVPFGPLEELPLLAVLIGATTLASALCKVIAIRLLAGLDPHWRRYIAMWAVLAALCAITMAFGISVSSYISLVSIGIALLVGLFVREAYRLGREQSLGNAKLLAGMIGAQAVLLFVVGVFAFVTDTGALPDPRSTVPLAMPVVFGMLSAANNGVFVALVLDIYVKRSREARAEAIALESERSRLAERERLLADMHDGLGSQLASARIRVEKGQMDQPQIVDLLRECMGDLHLLVDSMRDAGEGLPSALSDLRYRLDRRLAGVGPSLRWSVSLDELPPLPASTVLNLLRGVQEAINNALKHADATEICLKAHFTPSSGLELLIEDNGRGIGAEAHVGRGFAGMKRRAFDVGASHAIEARPGGGTRVSFHLPTRVLADHR